MRSLQQLLFWRPQIDFWSALLVWQPPLVRAHGEEGGKNNCIPAAGSWFLLKYFKNKHKPQTNKKKSPNTKPLPKNKQQIMRKNRASVNLQMWKWPGLFFGLLKRDFPSGLFSLLVSSYWQRHLKFPLIPGWWCLWEAPLLRFYITTFRNAMVTNFLAISWGLYFIFCIEWEHLYSSCYSMKGIHFKFYLFYKMDFFLSAFLMKCSDVAASSRTRYRTREVLWILWLVLFYLYWDFPKLLAWKWMAGMSYPPSNIPLVLPERFRCWWRSCPRCCPTQIHIDLV